MDKLRQVYAQMLAEKPDISRIIDEAMDARWLTIAFGTRPQHVKYRERDKDRWWVKQAADLATSTDPDKIRRRRSFSV